MQYSNGNPNFKEPDDLEKSVWRYLDLAKLLSLIHSNSLYLTRADQFKDIYEGSFPLKNVELMEKMETEGLKSFIGDYTHRSKLKKTYYVSCWRMDNYESEAMWKLYCPEGVGVAIKTSFRKLKNCLPSDCHIGMVNYIDYTTDKFNLEDRLAPIVHKRISFSFEQEVRIVWPHRKFWTSDPDKNDEISKEIDINFSSLIEKIVVSPYAPEWFYNVVSNIPELKNILCEWSDMKKTPSY